MISTSNSLDVPRREVLSEFPGRDRAGLRHDRFMLGPNLHRGDRASTARVMRGWYADSAQWAGGHGRAATSRPRRTRPKPKQAKKKVSRDGLTSSERKELKAMEEDHPTRRKKQVERCRREFGRVWKDASDHVESQKALGQVGSGPSARSLALHPLGRSWKPRQNQVTLWTRASSAIGVLSWLRNAYGGVRVM